VDGQPRVARLDRASARALAVGGAPAGPEPSNAVDDRGQATEHLTQLRVRLLGRVEVEVALHDSPQRLNGLVRWHRQPFVRDVRLAHSLDDRARGGDGRRGVGLDVLQGALELLLYLRTFRWRIKASSDLVGSEVVPPKIRPPVP